MHSISLADDRRCRPEHYLGKHRQFNARNASMSDAINPNSVQLSYMLLALPDHSTYTCLAAHMYTYLYINHTSIILFHTAFCIHYNIYMLLFRTHLTSFLFLLTSALTTKYLICLISHQRLPATHSQYNPSFCYTAVCSGRLYFLFYSSFILYSLFIYLFIKASLYPFNSLVMTTTSKIDRR